MLHRLFPIGLSRLQFCGLLLLLLISGGGTRASARRPGPLVSACSGIRLKASYLAEVKPGSGPGFHFVLQNETAKPVRLIMPVASSAHWYARENGRWMWRASNGEGGALVNAENPRGAMFAYQPAAGTEMRQALTVGALSESEWDESMRENPTLVYRPSCKVCNYPRDRQYRVVFGYAYLPPRGDSREGLLTCGLRSNEVDMPPMASSSAAAR